MNLLTGLFFHGSKILNVRRTFSSGLGGVGATSRSMTYSVWSGIPATNCIPQRGHLPGPLERMSGSIGQTYGRSMEGFDAGDAGGRRNASVAAGAGAPRVHAEAAV